MSAPALPRRTPGAAERHGDDLDRADGLRMLTGDEFEQLAPLVEGQRACFECERFPVRFQLTVTTTGYLGGTSSSTFKVCEHCVGKVAVSLPMDVAVVITRLPEES
jgi:hypothetical protein